ncbi:MAG: hypothetical protein PHE79_04160 [Eubacteriales bacterium]|nr:hypothetical protein [Eubacteriales bacterium]
MDSIKTEARQLLDWCTGNRDGTPCHEEQAILRGKISFAATLGLITDQEAAEYCRRIGLEKVAAAYERFAEIKEAKGA